MVFLPGLYIADIGNSITWSYLQHFPAKAEKKIQKICSAKNSLCFRKWNFLVLILKRFIYSLKTKLFLYFRKQKNSLNFRKWNFLALTLKKFLYFLKRKLFLYFWNWKPALFSPSPKTKKIHPEKISYASGNGNTKKLLILFSKESCSYVSRKGKPEKILYISGNGTLIAREIKKKNPFLKCFLYLRKWNFSPRWFCIVVPRMLRIWESFFYSQAFFNLHSLLEFGTTWFYQGFPRAGSSIMKVAGPPTEVRNRPGPSVCLNQTVSSKRY